MENERPLSGEEVELNEAIRLILESPSRKKLVIAGPGAGKTTLFKKLLEGNPGNRDRRLVLTFINNLKGDLEKDLGDFARVFTLHGYCINQLYRQASLRAPLSSKFKCYPGLATVIKEDWEIIRGSESPHFVNEMRSLADENEIEFYVERGNYYDAVDFDDAVYRVYRGLTDQVAATEKYDMVLIDEFQDFNNVEAGIINSLGQDNAIIIAGDDDQALYSKLRHSSWDNIRQLCIDGDFEVFMLPFCMRCPEVVVNSVNDIIEKAIGLNKLEGRIDKPFRYFPPAKGADSASYPNIIDVETSAQRDNANYMGRYVANAISDIPDDVVAASTAGGYPCALVIVAKPYRDQIVKYLEESGIQVATRRDNQTELDRKFGLMILKNNPESNFGWRIVLRTEKPKFERDIVLNTVEMDRTVFSLLPAAFRERIMAEANELEENDDDITEKAQEEADAVIPKVLVTSFEGAKGLSAQHVFLCGLHNGEIPRDPQKISDIEICKFLVGLSRTRKQCTLIHTRNFAGNWKSESIFIKWINPIRLERIRVDAAYWKANGVGQTS